MMIISGKITNIVASEWRVIGEECGDTSVLGRG